MRACPFCAEDIQDAAVVCKHCGREIAAAKPVAVPQKKTGSGRALGGALALLLFIGWCASLTRTPATSSSATPPASSSAASLNAPAATPPPAAGPVLELLSSRGGPTEGGGYYNVEGQVKNVSDGALKAVEAVTTWYDKDDAFVTSDSAMIEYDPLLPGQTSPFKTMSRANPAMQKYSVEFKRVFGGGLNTADKRKGK